MRAASALSPDLRAQPGDDAGEHVAHAGGRHAGIAAIADGDFGRTGGAAGHQRARALEHA